jgi:tRNA pseudouridine55 synthase
MDGLLPVDKPAGPTSHDVVAWARRLLKERRVGHTGTLDPAASGILQLVVGRATRLARFLADAEKEYRAVIRLGWATDTYDSVGAATTDVWRGAWPSVDEVAAALRSFVGTHAQQPPAYSAKKIGGKRSHRLARRATRQTEAGVPVIHDLPAQVEVTAYRLVVVNAEQDLVTIDVTCSPGFYIRSLAHALGERLGTHAHLTSLRRTRIGDVQLVDAISLAALEAGGHEVAYSALVPLAQMLTHLPAVTLTVAGTKRATHGLEIGPGDISATVAGTLAGVSHTDPAPPMPPVGTSCRLFDPSGELIGVASPGKTPGFLHPSVVLM